MNPTTYTALVAAHKRLNVFRELSIRAKDTKSMTLQAQEIWEPEDQDALNLILDALHSVNGVPQGLFAPSDSPELGGTLA